VFDAGELELLLNSLSIIAGARSLLIPSTPSKPSQLKKSGNARSVATNEKGIIREQPEILIDICPRDMTMV